MSENQVLDPEFLTYTEAAELLKMNVGTLRNLVCAGTDIPYYRISRRIVRFDKQELVKWVRGRKRRGIKA